MFHSRQTSPQDELIRILTSVSLRTTHQLSPSNFHTKYFLLRAILHAESFRGDTSAVLPAFLTTTKKFLNSSMVPYYLSDASEVCFNSEHNIDTLDEREILNAESNSSTNPRLSKHDLEKHQVASNKPLQKLRLFEHSKTLQYTPKICFYAMAPTADRAGANLDRRLTKILHESQPFLSTFLTTFQSDNCSNEMLKLILQCCVELRVLDISGTCNNFLTQRGISAAFRNIPEEQVPSPTEEAEHTSSTKKEKAEKQSQSEASSTSVVLSVLESGETTLPCSETLEVINVGRCASGVIEQSFLLDLKIFYAKSMKRRNKAHELQHSPTRTENNTNNSDDDDDPNLRDNDDSCFSYDLVPPPPRVLKELDISNCNFPDAKSLFRRHGFACQLRVLKMEGSRIDPRHLGYHPNYTGTDQDQNYGFPPVHSLEVLNMNVKSPVWYTTEGGVVLMYSFANFFSGNRFRHKLHQSSFNEVMDKGSEFWKDSEARRQDAMPCPRLHTLKMCRVNSMAVDTLLRVIFHYCPSLAHFSGTCSQCEAGKVLCEAAENERPFPRLQSMSLVASTAVIQCSSKLAKKEEIANESLGNLCFVSIKNVSAREFPNSLRTMLSVNNEVLVHLELHKCKIEAASDVFAGVNNLRKTLRSLSLTNISSDSFSAEVFEKRFSKLTFLRSLNLSQSNCFDDGDLVLKTVGKCFPFLRELDVSHLPNVSDEGIKAIRHLVIDQEHLIAGTNSDNNESEDCHSFVKKGGGHLKYLNLEDLGDITFQSILYLTHREVRKTKSSSAEDDDEANDDENNEIEEVPNQNHTLEELNLCKCTSAMYDDSVHEITRSFRNLKVLDLQQCTYITSLAVRNYIKRLRNLRRLNMIGVDNVGEKATDEVCQSLKGVKTSRGKFYDCGDASAYGNY